ncbi:phosphoglycerate dehydrogenase-like enzyme [Lewinella marina]|uniref:Phosphoglycerate dehydrogenase n=1 Tax=Neolewinella marina TaxID=438751 RepID=A0A2G0CDS9_9BACT|nr:NAD(P)-dependent oxidoreductase [Neolewinella marina]NJB85882.1 phosphoglycerate dehydrogenase-like enzyme [Neolewinella marina]PHK98141.1 phosphoglycerate dehydrogenase [Neolewinella marina]
MKHLVYLLEPVDERALKELPTERFEVIPAGDHPADFTAVRAIVVRGKEQVDRALIDRCPGLKVIVRNGVGVNNIDVDYATQRGVQVLNVPGLNAATVAEHTLGLMLLLVRGMYRLVNEVKAGNWDYRLEYAAPELRGLTLGIVGKGDIGQRVAAGAGALGMSVRHSSRQPGDRAQGYRELPELLAECDVVSLHLPLTDGTRGMIGADALRQMKAGSYLINTARGELVDGPALLAALQSGHLAGYASDLMVSGDAATVRQLVAHPNVLITPHAASLTELTFYELSERGLRHVAEFLDGKPIGEEYRVNRI